MGKPGQKMFFFSERNDLSDKLYFDDQVFESLGINIQANSYCLLKQTRPSFNAIK